MLLRASFLRRQKCRAIPVGGSCAKKDYNLPEILRGGTLSAIVGFYGPRNSPFCLAGAC